MPRKILDIAKEMDMPPYDLADKLKSEGYDVRRPTDELSDDDVAKVIASFGKPKTTEKKATKAVVRKKAKKKVVKKAVEPTEKVSEEKKTVVRKTVIRRKSAEEEVEAPQVEPETEVTAVEVQQEEVAPVVEENEAEQPSSGGLRVVKKAAKKVEEPVVEEKPVEAPVKEEKKEVRGLRIVSKPDPAVKAEEARKEKARQDAKTTSSSSSTTTSTSADAKKGDDKKKVGGLASMMSGKRTVNKASQLNQVRADNELKSYSTLSSLGRPIYTQVKRKRAYGGPSQKTELTEIKDSKRYIEVHSGAYIDELAKKLKVKFKELKDKVLKINLLVKMTDYVGLELAAQIAALYDYRVVDISFNEDEVIGKEALSEEEIEKLPLRNPIITIMGHVDHGKTTLLDYIRNAKVADGEAGGITQHIGAYSVDVNGKRLSFLDTPGHAAFAAMRQRGADVTDIVVLVVAADDGVMPQTKESINFCNNANKNVIIAVNKMDKEGANPDRVKSELAELGITPEDWGGDTQFCHISALNGDGVDELLEAIAIQAEVMELRADPKGIAEGVVIESKVEQGRGPVATVLVQTGTLKKGDSIVVGETYGRARNLTSDTGAQVTTAGPSSPVQIIGLNQAPSPGDILNVVKNEREGKKIAQNRVNERKDLAATPAKKKMTLEDFFASAGEAGKEKKVLNLIIRTDVQGSFEAIKEALEKIGNDEVSVKVIAGGVGAISDNDVSLASATDGFLIGFNMRPVTSARRLAEQQGVDVKTYSIIYELINDIKLALEGLLDPEFIEEFIGRAQVRDTFSIPKIGFIAGSLVIDGKIKDGCNIRLLRQGKIVFDGKMSSLKRFKDDVKEVKNGYECGIGLENFNDVKVDDVFEAYMMIEKKRTLDDVQI